MLQISPIDCLNKSNFNPIIFKSIAFFIIFFSFIFHICQSSEMINIKDGFIQINNINIYYKTMGSGPPIFILHGGPGDAHDTMLQFKKLADQYKLIFYDQRAAGRSSGDEDTAAQAVDNFIEDLEQLRLKLAPEKIDIIAGSWGAMLAMNYAFKYSENINSLVLVSSMGISSDYLALYRANIARNRTREDSIAIEQIAKSDEVKNNDLEAIEKYWRLYFKAYCYNPTYADSITLWIRDTTYHEVEGRYNRLWEYFRNYDIRDKLSSISCPTLILYGDYDPTPFEYIQPIDDSIPNSELVIIEEAGHWLWVEAPDKIMPIIRDFLKNK
ncbi:MAG: alpha/beta fold hydrolase [Candidatus Zixiibacteriota bacterium]